MKAETGAILSDCRLYRYSLWRVWNVSQPVVLFIGLNPSTADERNNDPTLKRCLHYSQSWGYGGLYMANLFAFRATNPQELYAVSDPVGKENDKWIARLVDRSSVVVAAWGNRGRYMNRSKEVSKLIPSLKCIRVNKSGEPSHPLYLKKNSPLISFQSNNEKSGVQL